MHRPDVDRRRRWDVALVAVASLGMLFVSAGPAASAPAQDPTCPADQVYGCPPPDDGVDVGGVTQQRPQCTATPNAGTPGTRVEALVTDVPNGQTADLRFNGHTVASETAEATGSETTADVRTSFVVPATNAGTYSLVAVGPGFQADCSGFAVQAGDVGGGGGGRGPLARTGMTVATWLVVAAVLIVGGRVLQQRGDRSRLRVRR